MNEDCRKRGLSNKKILTVVAISTLLLSSGNVIATQTTIDGSLSDRTVANSNSQWFGCRCKRRTGYRS